MHAHCVGTLFVATLCAIAFHSCSSSAVVSQPDDPLYRVMAELVKPHGYPLEQHFVTTNDGYILRMFRIPTAAQTRGASPRAQLSKAALPARRYLRDAESKLPARQLRRAAHALPSAAIHNPHNASRSGHTLGQPLGGHRRTGAAGPNPAARPVIYLQHALADSSADWVMQGPGNGLAFVLADAGYDVWMGNVRGNRFSRNHTQLDPDSSGAFWAFSFDQHAAVDLPAMVNASLAASGALSLAYVGYSQGTLIAFAALSSQPWLAERVTLAVLLAPVAFVTHITSLPLRLSAMTDTDKLYQLLGIKEYAAASPGQAAVMGALCRVRPSACLSLLGAIGGSNDANVDPRILPAFFRYFPAGTSVHNMAHWSQAVRQANASDLRRFDWGQACKDSRGLPQKCNMRVYGQLEPPAYDLASITTPLALFTGGNDALADPVDVELLLRMLPAATVVAHHHERSYCHWDFGIGRDLRQRVFPEIMRLLSTYHPVLSG